MDISAAGPRALRAALFTALCVTLSAASHVLLSGVPLPLSTVLALCAAVFALSYALAGRERGYWRIAALLVPLELAADTVFTTGQHACYGQSGGPVTGPLRSVGVDLLCGGGSFGTPLARMAAARDGAALRIGDGATSWTAPWLLLAAHVAVGLAAALWLRRGEAALGQLLRAVGVLTFRPLLTALATVAASVCAALAPRRPAPRPVRRVRTALAHPLLLHSLVRRGPPCSPATA
ncbi:hypothetical protein [Streptomyces sp. H27-D2]|uniref:hypothetical protein n=1 Tax=Streptomyces sp. H27-D2 TaxID=3046304 RepID=UPI002DBBF376|nr:hypothetical protein [Streptomyces sp. H27-D2]MEC4017931.1 hypothetical protein [Streptomyces sp. H27-D2]